MKSIFEKTADRKVKSNSISLVKRPGGKYLHLMRDRRIQMSGGLLILLRVKIFRKLGMNV